jgi:hypothetical protein
MRGQQETFPGIVSVRMFLAAVHQGDFCEKIAVLMVTIRKQSPEAPC